MKKLLTLVVLLGMLLSLQVSFVGAQEPDPTDAPEPTVYVVQEGDTAESIATLFGISVDELLTANELGDAGEIEPGLELIIPPAQDPTQEATEEPTAEPTQEATEEPTAEPTQEATEEPTAEPTQEATEEPTAEPTQEPTEEATVEPTAEPTDEGPAGRTVESTPVPTPEPLDTPSDVESEEIGAMGASSASYTSYIFVANPRSTGGATYAYKFYPSDGSPAIDLAGGTLNGFGSASLDMAKALSGSFRGSGAIESSDELFAVVMNYTTSGGDFTVHAGYNGGSDTLYAPAIVKNWGGTQKQNSRIVIQNASGATISTVTVQFINRDTGAVDKTITKNNLAAGYPWFIEVKDQLSASQWIGSAIINASGEIAATVETLYGGYEAAFGHETVAAGSNRLCSPTAMWYYGSQQQASFLAVQNPNNFTIAVDITYYDLNNRRVGSTIKDTIPALSKKSYRPTDTGDSRQSYLGSAVVDVFTANRSGPANAMAIHNIAFWNATTPASSFDLVPCGTTGGSTRQVLPMLLWDKLGKRSFVAIQNVGTSNVNITVRYYNPNGTKVHEKTYTNVAKFIKVNSRPSDFTSSSWQGSMVIEATGNIAALVTTVTTDNRWLGSYTGLGF